MLKDLSLILKSDKEIYLVGDEITLTYTFLSNCNHDVYLVPWGGHYTTNWISAYNERGIKLQDLPLVYYEIKFIPSKDDFILIRPKDSYSITIKGKIVKSEFSKFNRKSQRKYKGIFINFVNSAIFLEGPGNFTLIASYNGLTEWRDKGIEFYNTNNIWAGKIESNEVKIIIRGGV